MDDLLAFGGVEVVDALKQRLAVGEAELFLFGVDLFRDGQIVGRKKLLRSAATGSTRAVVAPIDLFHAWQEPPWQQDSPSQVLRASAMRMGDINKPPTAST